MCIVVPVGLDGSTRIICRHYGAEMFTTDVFPPGSDIVKMWEQVRRMTPMLRAANLWT
jgi:hypothetical protein